MKKDIVRDLFLDHLRKIPIIQPACEKLSIARSSIYRWKEDPEFERQLDDAMRQGYEYANDLSESQLVSLVGEKNLGAIKHFLKYNHPRYGAKAQPAAAAGPLEHIDPRDPSYQKVREATERYEEELKKILIQQIHEKPQ